VGLRGGLRGLQPPYCPKLYGAPHCPPKILDTIDEGREGVRKKKGHRPLCLPFLASSLAMMCIVG